MIKTNKVKLDLHYNNIIRDYDVYKVYQEHKGDDEKERTVRKSVWIRLEINSLRLYL